MEQNNSLNGVINNIKRLWNVIHYMLWKWLLWNEYTILTIISIGNEAIFNKEEKCY